MPDELDTRVRSLEAERQRPVPPPPPRAPNLAQRLLEEVASSNQRHPEPPGPRGSSALAQHDTTGGRH